MILIYELEYKITMRFIQFSKIRSKNRKESLLNFKFNTLEISQSYCKNEIKHDKSLMVNRSGILTPPTTTTTKL